MLRCILYVSYYFEKYPLRRTNSLTVLDFNSPITTGKRKNKKICLILICLVFTSVLREGSCWGFLLFCCCFFPVVKDSILSYFGASDKRSHYDIKPVLL